VFDPANFIDGFFAASDADLFAKVEFSAIHEDFLDDRQDKSFAFLTLGYGSVNDAPDGNVLDIVIVLKEAGIAELFGLENFGRFYVEFGGRSRRESRGGSRGRRGSGRRGGSGRSALEQPEGSIGLNFERGARNRDLLTVIKTDRLFGSGIEKTGGREKRADSPSFVVYREHLRLGHK
jgi:hypothetical protein